MKALVQRMRSGVAQRGGPTLRNVLWKAWALLGSLLVAGGVYRLGITLFAAVAAVIVASWFAYRFRLTTVVALLLSVLAPQLVLMVSLL